MSSVRGPWLRLAGWVFVVEFVISVLDPWGASRGTQQLSARVTLVMASPWYSLRWPVARSVRDRISMVLVDEDMLRQRGLPYPLPYGAQADLIWSIASRVQDPPRTRVPADLRPAAVFLDLLYADKRPPDDAFGLSFEDFDATLSEVAAWGTLAGGLPELAGRMAPLAESRPGVLVADTPVDTAAQAARLAGPGGQAASARPDGLSLIRTEAAPSEVLPDPLLYALAPDGRLSPAVRLALWMCAADPWIRAQSPACAGPPVPVAAVRAAAFASAAAVTSRACAALLRAATAPPATREAAREACLPLALTYAANAGWAPERAEAEEAGSSAAGLLAEYARARRDGHFAGALAGLRCLPESGHRARALASFDDEARRARLVALCSARSAREEEAAKGPFATVLWAAGVRDGGPVDGASREVTRFSPAAPYVWARGPDGTLSDSCADQRIGDSTAARAGETLRLFLRNLAPGGADATALCAYHRNLRPGWLISGAPVTRAFADEAIQGRVVLVGASVAGIPDLIAMRDVIAPGLWAHAMALDNVLSLGPALRQAQHGGAPVPDILSLVLTLGMAFLLSALRHRSPMERLESRLDGLLLAKGEAGIATHVVALCLDTLIAAALLLVLSVAMALFLPLPLFDWLGAAASASIALELRGPEHQVLDSKEAEGNPETNTQ
ncbi:CHASE2 domain-containing protein [Paroceanicella profunda]|nr:CHASE2 domain-containing protein [Paroceanicella profunda]